MKKKLKTATGPELAEILGVTHQAVYKGVKSGRLSKCVSGKAREGRVFEIFTACIEWENSRDNGQVREPRPQISGVSSSSFPPVAESRQAFEYYQAANEQISALKDAGRLVDLELTQRELFQAARLVRDRLQEIPEKLRFTFLSHGLSDSDSDGLVRTLSGEIYQALLYLAETDVSRLREEVLSGAVQEASESLIGVDGAGH